MDGVHDTLSVRHYGASPGSHRHDHVQVLVGLEGVLELEIEGRGVRVGAGHGCLVPAGERHDFESRGGSRCLVLDTRRDPWSTCGSEPAQPAQVHALATYLAGALPAAKRLAALHGPALLLEAWQPADPVPAASGRRIDWMALQSWVQHHLEQPLTVAGLAQQVHLSASQFAWRFQQAHGIPVMQWLRAQRLARARLLRGSGMAVGEVARRTGYRSPSALTAALRRGG